MASTSSAVAGSSTNPACLDHNPEPLEPRTTNQHLSYPSQSVRPPTPPPSSTTQPRQIVKDRLYVGNLHPTVDEYSLLRIFSKFGKVTKLDFLFHKTGLMKGKPRGYAFVEYGNQDDALKALEAAHDKVLRGRKLVVTFAHQAPLDQAGSGPSVYGSVGKHRKVTTEAGKPTTLSMLKSAVSGRQGATKDKIALMEAKLRHMESTNPKSPTADSSSSLSSTITTPLHHPSLPLKPPDPIPPTFSNHNHNRSLTDSRIKMRTSTPKSPLPSLPIPPQPRISADSGIANSNTLSSVSRSQSQSESLKHSGLVGVRIKKMKDK